VEKKARGAYKELKEETRKRQAEIDEQRAQLDKQQAELDLQSSQSSQGEKVTRSNVCPATLGGRHIWSNRNCSGCGISQDGYGDGDEQSGETVVPEEPVSPNESVVSASVVLQSAWRGKKQRTAYKLLQDEERQKKQQEIDRQRILLQQQQEELNRQKKSKKKN